MTGPSTMFLDQRLDNLSQAEVLARLYALNRAPAYGYVVTPNVHHLLRLQQSWAGDTRHDYGGADLSICDSRIVEVLARLVGKRVAVYPGADIVKDFLASTPPRRYLVGVVGPAADKVEALATLYPEWRFVHYPAPMMQIGSEAFNAAVGDALAGEWDFLLIGLGFPKQEAFAAALRRRGRARGTALCIGASVDFLVGTQKRAPVFLQRARLEWLHRLLHDPRRLWHRYLVECPRILYWFVKVEVMGWHGLRSAKSRIPG